eukprot:3454801-Alexandrium_andersonii.AAC.1
MRVPVPPPAIAFRISEAGGKKAAASDPEQDDCPGGKPPGLEGASGSTSSGPTVDEEKLSKLKDLFKGAIDLGDEHMKMHLEKQIAKLKEAVAPKASLRRQYGQAIQHADSCRNAVASATKE